MDDSKPTRKAIIVRLGSIQKTVDSGLNFKMPLIDKVVKMDMSTNAVIASELGYSKDGQTVNFEVTVTYSLSPSEVENTYKEFRKDYVTRVINPSIKDSIKVYLLDIQLKE